MPALGDDEQLTRIAPLGARSRAQLDGSFEDENGRIARGVVLGELRADCPVILT